MRDLVIYGLGPFARMMHYYFTRDSGYRVVAFTADASYIQSERFCELPVVPFQDLKPRYPPDSMSMFAAIGYRRMRDRKVLFDRAKGAGYELANYISSRAISYPNLRLGENNAAFGGVQFEPFVSVGDNNVFWSDTLICHDVVIGSGNYFAARCLVGGGCRVGDGCFFGNGSVLINDLSIANETHALPAATLLQNTKECHRYLGSPAREFGSHEDTGIVIERG